jgi:hypothetical protein
MFFIIPGKGVIHLQIVYTTIFKTCGKVTAIKSF